MCNIKWNIYSINSTYTVDSFNVFATREYAPSTDALGSTPACCALSLPPWTWVTQYSTYVSSVSAVLDDVLGGTIC